MITAPLSELVLPPRMADAKERRTQKFRAPQEQAYNKPARPRAKRLARRNAAEALRRCNFDFIFMTG